jgi:[CysO sulfur-carrier protein]-S-L-cysteine hydrolase
MPHQSLSLNRQYWEKMQNHVSSIYPEEACGLLAGNNNQVLAVIPVNNILKSRTQFRMDPRDQLTEFLNIEKNNWELLGIYHSHPQGNAYPSETDIAQAYYPDIAYLVWALSEQEWVCQAFHLEKQMATPMKLSIEK